MSGRAYKDISTAHKAIAIDVSGGDQTLEAGCRAIWVGGAGNVKVDFVSQGTAITLTGVPAGTLLPIQVSKVYNSGTTATTMTALY